MKTKLSLLLCLFCVCSFGQKLTFTTNAPVVSASTPYTAGFCIGGVFTNVVLAGIVGYETPRVESIGLQDIDGQAPNLTLLLFNHNPLDDGWTLTDYTAVVGPTTPTEPPLVISILSSDWQIVGTQGFLNVSDIHMPTTLTDSVYTVYAAFVTTSTPTFSTTSSLLVKTYYNY